MVPFLFASLLPVTAAGALPRTPVILSTDVGNEIDDQWAIVYLLANPAFDVLGIVSAHAPTVPDPSARTTLRVLTDVVEHRMRMAVHPPLYEGSSLPLADDRAPREGAGIDFLVEASRPFSRENRLAIVVIGAATDAASALLKDPTMADRIRIVAMGFKNWPEGGDEYNVANDVRAWQVILRSRVPVVIGCGDVCRATLALTPAQAKDLVAARGPIGAWLWDDYQAWYYRFVKPLRKDDFTKPWIIWDLIALAHLVGMTEHNEVARPVLQDNHRFKHVDSDEKITWITGLDTKRLWADFVLKLDEYQRTHSVGPE
jgi:inosine-uridine nucleoside N-ribohydrolase